MTSIVILGAGTTSSMISKGSSPSASFISFTAGGQVIFTGDHTSARRAS